MDNQTAETGADKMQTVSPPFPNRKTRYLELDLARAIPLLGLPFVHFYEEMTEVQLLTGSIGTWGKVFLYLCAIGPSVFMIFLGMNITFSTHSTAESMRNRGFKTIFYFFLLNLIRFTIPAFIAGACGYDNGFQEGLSLFFTSDILFFAGLTFLCFSVVLKYKIDPFYLILAGICFATVNTLIPPLHLQSPYLRAFLGNFFYVDDHSYFPFLSWFIFPAIGYYMGFVIRKLDSELLRNRFYFRMFLVSLVSLTAVCVCLSSYGLDVMKIAASPANDYITDFFNILITVLLAGIWTSLIAFLCRLCPQKVLLGASKISDAILVFYAIQWILVGWVEYILCALGYYGQPIINDAGFFISAIAIFAAALYLALLIEGRKRRKESEVRAQKG